MVSRLLLATQRPVQTRFRCGFAPEVLNLAANSNSPAHYAKGTQSPVSVPKDGHRAPTACKCMVSGPFHTPRRGSFHRSLALLFTIGCRGVLSLGGGPPSFTRSSTSSVLLWYVDRNGGHRSFAYRAITFCGRTFQTVLLIVSL